MIQKDFFDSIDPREVERGVVKPFSDGPFAGALAGVITFAKSPQTD
jgi:hypothetical protein